MQPDNLCARPGSLRATGASGAVRGSVEAAGTHTDSGTERHSQPPGVEAQRCGPGDCACFGQACEQGRAEAVAAADAGRERGTLQRGEWR